MEEIAKIEVLENGQLAIVLGSGGNASYQYIYREAAGVTWDNQLKAFKSPAPQGWDYPAWFRQIVKVAANCNIHLRLSKETTWVNVSAKDKETILAEAGA